MAFKALEIVTEADRAVLASLSYRKARLKGGDARPRLVLGIPKRAMDGKKVKAEQAFALLIGDGNDKGKARVIFAATGPAMRQLKTGGASIRFGFVPMLGNDAAEKEFIGIRAIEHGGHPAFELDLPKWFKAD